MASAPARITSTVFLAVGLLLACLVAAPEVTAQTCPTAPTIASPANDARGVTLDPILDWNPSSGTPTSYDVYFGTAGRGCSASAIANVDDSVTSYDPGHLSPGITYEWRIVAKKTFCTTPPSSPCVQFTTTSCNNAAPLLISPADGATNRPLSVEFVWDDVLNAFAYELFVSENGAAAFVSKGSTKGTTLTATLTSGASVRWFVRASFSLGCPTETSAVRTFTVFNCANNDEATPLAPANGATNIDTDVTFSWDSPLKIGGDFGISISVNGGAFTETRTGSATTLTRSFSPGSKIEWFVKTYFSNGCPPTTSSRFLFTTAPCPSATRLVEPANGAKDLPSIVLFEWAAVTGASEYGLFLSENNGTFIETRTTSTGIKKALAAGSTYTWFVRTYAKGCTAVDTPQASFATARPCPTATPTLLEPAAGSSVPSAVTFKWSAVAEASLYEVLVSVDGGLFNVVGSTTGTSLSRTLSAGKISWRVRTSFTGCDPTLSPSSEFTSVASLCPTAGPARISPADGATLTSPVTFSWRAVDSAISYRVIAAVDGGTPIDLGSTELTSLTAQVPSGTVDWYVIAYFERCRALESTHGKFTAQPATTCDPNARATLLSPAEGARVSTLVEFSWSPVKDAAAYRLFISVNGTAAAEYELTKGTTSFQKIPDGNHSWFIETQFAGCKPTRSDIRTFSISTETCPTDGPRLVAPANGALVSTPVTMSWTAVTGAVGYRVWASVDGGRSFLAGETTGATSVSASLPSGKIEWVVEAVFRSCAATVSASGFFSVGKSTTCTPTAATLVAPADQSKEADAEITFTWNPVAGALFYRVFVSINGQAPSDLGSTTETTLVRKLPAGTMVWYVETAFSACPSTFSDKRTFFVPRDSICGSSPTVLLTPESRATITAPVLFTWSAVTDASEYRIWVSADTNVPKIIGTTTDTKLSAFLSPGLYSWYVETIFRLCPSTESEIRTFRVSESTTCTTDTPRLLSPAAGDTSILSPVTFLWSSVTGAAAYEVYLAREDGVASVIGVTKDTQLTLNLSFGNYRWYVQAIFSNCRPTRSEENTFSIQIPAECVKRAPLLRIPADGSRVLSPVDLAWTAVDGAIEYKVYTTLGDGAERLLTTTTSTRVRTELPSGEIVWRVAATSRDCPETSSGKGQFLVLDAPPPCGTPDRPEAKAVGEVPSGKTYELYWHTVPNAELYEVEESTSENFSGEDVTMLTINGASTSFRHDVSQPTPYYYRVRAISNCNRERSLFSDVVRVVVAPPQRADSRTFNVTTPAGDLQNVIQQIFIPGSGSGKSATATSFTAATSKPWLTVSPASGIVPPEGLTLTVTAATSNLPPGTNTGTINITSTSAPSSTTGSSPEQGGGSSSTPISISLAAPVSPLPKNSPTSNSLIIPAVGHAIGATAFFQSDVRITNVSAQSMRYQLTFTPTGQNGSLVGKQTTVDVLPGQTVAFDDVLKAFYGVGSANENATGVLEIRPLTANASASVSGGLASPVTVASSRTYAVTANGTYGQFIPAVPYSSFVGKGKVLTLGQIAQSSAYRTNVGVVEASGQPATVQFTAYAKDGSVLGQWTENLQAGEHRQYDRVLANKGISVEEGRLEVAVLSDTGRVTAYASVVDNLTSDPLLVSPMQASDVAETKYVVPGVADITNPSASWRTDLQIYNGGTTAETATLSFYPQTGGTAPQPMVRQIVIPPGQLTTTNNILQSLFGVSNVGGALQITTSSSSKLVPTARTYNQTASGTYGQFVPAVTPAEGVGLGSRSLQLLQIEQSSRYRTNLGLVEMTGSAATVEVVAILPDSIAAPFKRYDLQPNEFRQINQVLKDMGVPEAYNARISIKVVGGGGKVTAYASVVDNVTSDPTYVPAQ